MRMICGTLQWSISQKPTSLDIVFNSSTQQDNATKCTYNTEEIFFSDSSETLCPVCNGKSYFLTSTHRIALVSNISNFSVSSNAPNNSTQNHTIHSKQFEKTHNTKHLSNDRQRNVLRDITNFYSRPPPCSTAHPNCNAHITNVFHARPPLFLAARPDDAELHAITRTNNMLSNFVVSYFFKILACNFPSILYQEFLFDFVKREGGWKEFVQYSRREGHSTDFLEKLKDNRLICIVPICHDIHLTLIIRKFVENVWEIYYIDSISQGSDDRMRQWQNLFQDDDLFSGNWIKLKIIPQTELECGARVCLHGLCFALSSRNTKDIGRQLERIKDLAVRSRLLVSHICTDGQWSNPGWLKSIIGTPTSTYQAGATATMN